MAKREISSTLKNLKFMQRAAQREEKTNKKEEVVPHGNFSSPATIRKCVVIMEGDPHPGAVMGRMSFGSFNPSVDKLNEEATGINSPEVSKADATCSSSQNEGTFRNDGSSQNEEYATKTKTDVNGELKRKKAEGASETEYQNKSPKTDQGGQHSSPHSNNGSFKQPKREKLDWNVLRPKGQKTQNQRR